MSIKIGANLDFRGKDPNFARDQFETLSEMKSISDNAIDEGHISYCKETGLHYEFKSENSIDENTGKWREFKPGGENLNIDSDIDLEELSLNDTIFPLANGKTAQLIVTKNFDSPITYKSSDEAIATVSETGLITKLANGEATITVEAGTKSTTAKVVNLITKNSNVLPLLNIPYLHSRGITGKGVKVAVLESFVKNNEEFEMDGWYDPIAKKLYRTEPSASDLDKDIVGIDHTYKVSTLIHGKTRGIAPDCEFYNILCTDGKMGTPGFDREKCYKCICDGIEWAIEFGIKVISITMTLRERYTKFREVFKKAYDAGITICVGMCNCINGENEYSYYNGYVNNAYCLMIGGCEKNGDRSTITCKGEAMMFNNYGFLGMQAWDASKKYNGVIGATSAATALTTGCVALLLQQDPSLTPRQIYHIFKDNAILHSSSTPGVKSIDYGWGRINVPVLSNITYKSDAECKVLDAQLPIENINAVIFNDTKRIILQPNAEGEYDVNVNDIIYINPIIIPVEKDLYLSESITSNDNMLHYSNDYINTFNCYKPGKCEITIIFKGISLQKKYIFNISE